MKYLLVIVTAVFCLFSCKKNNLEPYHGADNIYFSGAKLSSPDDSMTVSFGLLPDIEDSLIKIPISVMGKPAEKDRPYKVKILDVSTAEEGVDYSFNKEDCFVPAGQLKDS